MDKVKLILMFFFFSLVCSGQSFKRVEFFMKPGWTVDSLAFHKKELSKKYGIQVNFTNMQMDKARKPKSFDMTVSAENRKGTASFSGFAKAYHFGFIIDNSWFSRQAFVVGYIAKK